MGSAVTETELTRQLEQFAKAGMGGVHIIPIYGVKGYESQFIPFLSERWLAVFAHTVREANRLGLGVDLTAGTGWPFGGPNVTPDMAAHQWQLTGNQLTTALTGQQVKRPAPGGAGPALDYFDRDAVSTYLRRFDSTLVRLPERPRAVYNDSYELYGANWTRDFLVQFKQRRGYTLEGQLRAFLDTNQTETGIRVRQDYHETLADLLTDGTATWTGWATRHRYQTRNQAHGSPGNLLDLYALADIPETESFGSSQFPIPGLRVDEGYEVDRFGTPHPLAMKFASSAAHLTGKRLVSSETGTWLANHFNVSLSQLKPQMDELFTSGVNHLFYHGTTYSPGSEPWPGWLFYASTNYGPSSHFWNELPALNRYVERCQTPLQASKPDNDVLVYFPIHDLWATRAKSAGGVHQLEVHHVDRWLLPLPFGRLCDTLRQRGYSFDYVSDKQLNQLSVSPAGTVTAVGGRYRVILIPACQYMPETTLRRLRELAKQGATIVFERALPQQVPGFNAFESRNAQLRLLAGDMQRMKTVRVAADAVQTLAALRVPAEQMAALGLAFIRKQVGGKPVYFIANLANRFGSGWIPLASPSTRWYRYDPLSDQTTAVPIRQMANAPTQVWLRLLPGQSCFLTSGAPPQSVNEQNVATAPDAPPVVDELTGPWSLTFLTGKPAGLPPARLNQLVTWTALSDSASYFSGTVRYETTFEVAASLNPAATYRLSLGDVRETARVYLNGQEIGLAWSLPFEVTVPANLLRQTDNRLVIEVVNLSANYMRLRDGQSPNWKKFYDINIVDIRYRPFDATQWKPMPSGLLGPVRLVRDK